MKKIVALIIALAALVAAVYFVLFANNDKAEENENDVLSSGELSAETDELTAWGNEPLETPIILFDSNYISEEDEAFSEAPEEFTEAEEPDHVERELPIVIDPKPNETPAIPIE